MRDLDRKEPMPTLGPALGKETPPKNGTWRTGNPYFIGGVWTKVATHPKWLGGTIKLYWSGSSWLHSAGGKPFNGQVIEWLEVQP